MGEQRGLAPLLTVDLAPVTVELNLRESGARFPCKWSSVLEIYNYESRSFNASYPYYDAVCWAYQTRILRQSDLLYTGYDEKMDYRGACMLIYRFAALAGINTNVDQSQLLQVMSGNSNLTREAAKAMLWCNQKDITSRDSNLDELLDAYNTRISRYQMTSFLFYLCTYELNLGS